MEIKFRCHSCHAKVAVDEQLSGERVSCPNCGKAIKAYNDFGRDQNFKVLGSRDPAAAQKLYSAEFRSVQARAMRGDVDALYRLGIMYKYGQGWKRAAQRLSSWVCLRVRRPD